METIIKSKRAGTNEEHLANRERFRKEAEAIAMEGLRSPEIPIAIYLEEAAEAVLAGHKYSEALEAVGMPPDLPGQIGGFLDGLRGSQVIWRAGLAENGAKLELVVEQAIEARDETQVVAALALRDHPEGQRLLAAIEEGDTVPSVVAALTDLALIASKFRPEFAAIKVNADETAATLAAYAEAVEQAQFAENTEGVAAAKELRDRYYTLTVKPLADLRAFAQFAFRKEKSSRRRQAFLSAYIRARNRKQYRKAKAAAAVEPVTPDVVPEVAAPVPPVAVTAPAANDTVAQPVVVLQAA